MALVGNTFYQSSANDPGTGYAMYYWNQTDTGLIYVRNAGDTAWVLVGDSQLPYLGQLSTQGGVMNGAITGAHGLSPSTSNDFDANSLRMGGDLVSTKTYVDAQVATLNASIASGIATAIASAPTSSLDARIARNRGTWGPFATSQTGLVIELPVYTDGVPASEDECIWGLGWDYFYLNIVDGSHAAYTITETANRVYDVTALRNDTEAQPFSLSWWIIAFRKNS